MQRNKKAELFNDLHMGKVEVLFQKVSGERRKMICTLAPKALVEKFGTKYTGKVEFDAKAKAQPVFDVEKQEWRSFLYDKVLNYEKMPLEEEV
tara:strand:- start:553 stop:831 length:279 start_codon:yes stop_codon:yes gene_type:complete